MSTTVNGDAVMEIPINRYHKYAVTKIKTFRGRDGHGLNATLTRDGKAVALLLDEGCGGMLWFDWLDHGKSSEEALFKGFISQVLPEELVPKKAGEVSPGIEDTLSPATRMQFAMEGWVNAEVDRMLNDKKFRKLCKTTIVFQVGAKVGSDEFQCVKGLDLRAHVEQKYRGQKLRILNDEYKD